MNSKSALKLLLIDNDPIFRMGLKFSCEHFPDLEIVFDAEVGAETLSKIESLISEENNFLVILDIETNNLLPQNTEEMTISGIDFCQQLKTSYPDLSILLLTSLQDTLLLRLAQKLGVNGYCLKGISISDLVIVIRQVADGQFSWQNIPEIETIQKKARPKSSGLKVETKKFFNTLLESFCKSGLKQIDSSLLEVTSQLNERVKKLDRNDLSSLLNVAITSGQRRELLTVRWIISQLSPKSVNRDKQQQITEINRYNFVDANWQNMTELKTEQIVNSVNNNRKNLLAINSELVSSTTTEAINLQTTLFEATIAKLHPNLINLSGLPMEIDILRGSKKQELIYIALCKFEDILDELRTTSIRMEEIPKQRYDIVHNLWEFTSNFFVGEYYQLEISNGIGIANYFTEPVKVEVIPVLLNDSDNVHKFILDKIPLVEELISYLLFEVPLVIDNVSFEVGTVEAMERSEVLLQNLLISIANAVIQPLLNNFADVEEVKEDFYSQQLLSTRDIEKFRNSLSWKYRIEQYITEPKAIFESKFSLFVLNELGIKKISIYSSRRHELIKLSGVPLIVTLLLETRDAIAPGIRATVSFIGSGVVYLLTQVVGRGIGLVGRGIIQGVGSSFQDVKFGRNNHKEEARKG
ncbi:DUF3685 domain-containing protein [Okeania sp.]|uniref:DUF3685 domain-containing protein n=1 Tax=Okeania sp. TaxID=3100323 RepID=UPI002B4B4CC5|nr:DUF3685 domain-containing protein [Okeania sp.]MEB3341032.1 DUF3685 domain-containing protein [Okeania sp.]